MRYFIDTEFHDLGPGEPIELISIGIVAEDGRELYAINAGFNWLTASDWLRENVLPVLHCCHSRQGYVTLGMSDGIAHSIREFVGDDPDPEFWGYYCAFDYVVLSQLMGGFEAWPEGWPYYMHDLRQWLDERGHKDVRQPDDAPHNALEDACWIGNTFRTWRS